MEMALRLDKLARSAVDRRDGRRVEEAPPATVAGMGGARHRGEHSEAQGSTVTHLTIFDSIFDQLKLQISYRNLKFGQNRSCRGKDDLQLSFWAKADLRLGSRRKT